MSPLSVLLVSAEYPPDPGGVGDYTRCLAGALRQRGQRVSVLTAHNGQAQLVGASEERQSLGQALHWQWDTLWAVQAAITAVQPDIVHVQFQAGAYGMHPAILALPSLLRRTAIQAALLVTMHDLLVPYLFPKAGPIRSWALRRMMLAADQVVVTNETDYARLAVGNSQAGDLPLYNGRVLPQARRPTVIPIGSNIAVDPPPGYNRDEWRSQVGVAAGTTLLAYFGLISPTKGLDTILDALAFLPPNVRLLVIGGEAGGPQDAAYMAALQRRIATSQLRERVTITGHCDAHDVSAYLLSADIGVLPFRDGASFRRGSLLAALAHGLPTVTTLPQAGAPASPTIQQAHIHHEEHALLVGPDNPAQLAEAIMRLVSDAALRNRIARGASELAQHFSWPAIAAQHEHLYTGLTAQRRAATISVK